MGNAGPRPDEIDGVVVDVATAALKERRRVRFQDLQYSPGGRVVDLMGGAASQDGAAFGRVVLRSGLARRQFLVSSQLGESRENTGDVVGSEDSGYSVVSIGLREGLDRLWENNSSG
jgi:hypothetical protein